MARNWSWQRALAATAVTFLTIDYATWRIVTGRLEASVPGFVAQAEANGWHIESGPAVRTGWPFSAGVRLPGVVATRTLDGTGVQWAATDVVVSVTAIDPQALTVALNGTQTVKFGHAAAIALRADLAVIRLPMGSGTSSFEARDLAILGDPVIEVGYLRGSFAALDAMFAADQVRLRPALPSPFDRGFSLSARLALRPQMALTQASAAQAPAAAAMAWEAAGGRIELSASTLAWGPLHVSGVGESSLDRTLQPVGRAELEVEGAIETVDAAARAGLVGQSQASAARAVLQLLTLAAHGGPVRLPVVVQDRRLVVAGFPLLRLQEVDWGAR